MISIPYGNIHLKMCESGYGRGRRHVKEKTPIVVTSNGGAPLDQNIYQTVKGLCTADAAAR